jgi:hypothetical protein
VDLTFDHAVLYSNRDTVPVGEIARSLLATESAVKHLPQLLEALFEGLRVQGVHVELRRVEHESPLLERYVLKLLCEFQDDLTHAIAGIDKRRQDVIRWMKEHLKLVSRLIMVLLLYGAQEAYRIVRPDQPPPINIEGNNNVVITAAGNEVGVPPEELREIVREVVSSHRDRRDLAKSAVDFVAPAKRESGTTITTMTSSSDAGTITITRETIGEVPDPIMFEKVEPDEWTDVLENTLVKIVATDREHAKSGWAIRVPALDDKRLRLQLVPGIDLQALERFPRSRNRRGIPSQDET